MENSIKMQQIFGKCLVLICLFNSTSIISTYESNFIDLCRYEGICLNCSDGGCDEMCHFYDNNCCVNSSSSNTLLEKWQYSCIRKFPDMYDLHLDCRGSFDGVYGVYMVTKCSELWTDDSIKAKCETSSENDILSDIPVYNDANEIVTYKNMYCAFCNRISLARLGFWMFDLMCNEDQENDNDYENCVIRLKYRKHRMCAMDLIESCNVTADVKPPLRDKCENGLSQNVYVWEKRHKYRVYKNEFCAQCNNEADDLQCWAFQAFACWPEDLPLYNNVKAMISLTLYEHGNKDQVKLTNTRCGDGVLHDPFEDMCLNVTCLPLHNTCISGKCNLVELTASEFAIQNDSSLFFFALGDFIQAGRYFVKYLNVHVCLDDNQHSQFEIIKRSKLGRATKVVVSKGSDLSAGRITLSCLHFFLFASRVHSVHSLFL